MNGTLVYSFTLDNQYPPPMIQYDPVRWISYLMSALFPLLAIRVGIMAQTTKCAWLYAGSFASVLLFVALILRGTMGRTEADAFRMYEAMSILHLSAGFVLNGLLFVFTSKWIEVASQQGILGIFLTHMAVGYSAAAVVCTCVGVPLSFDSMEWRRISGYKLVSVSLIVSIGTSILAALLTLYHTTAENSGNRVNHLVRNATARSRLPVVLAPAVLMLTWMSFALARVSLPMDNVANTSDAMFYCLSVLPAIGAFAVWIGCAEEFLAAADAALGGGRGMSVGGHPFTRRLEDSDNDDEEYCMQEVTTTRSATPCHKAVASSVGGACCCSNNHGNLPAGERCAKCRYEVLLQRAMNRYT